MEKIKVGIIGVGGISAAHIKAYQANPRVELYAFCDIREDRLKEMAEQYGVTRTFTDKDEMLKLKELDAVSVCTWNSQHAPCVIAALNAGKHVLCEKPMATSVAEAKAMQEAALRNHKLLMIGFVRRYGNDAAILKDFIDQGSLGDIYYSKATYLRRNGNPGGWFGDKSRSGGGPLIDLGVHVLDLVRYLSGNPKPISVYGATFQKLFNRPNIKNNVEYQASDVSSRGTTPCDVEDLASALIRFEDGSVISLEASFSLNIKSPIGRIEMFGTKGGAKVEPELELYNDINGYLTNITFSAPTALSFNGLFAKEINHYVNCLLDGIECLSPAKDGVEIMRILDAIYESAALGHEIILQ